MGRPPMAGRDRMNAFMLAEKEGRDPRDDRRARPTNNTANEAGENNDQAGTADASMAPADETGDAMVVEE